MEVAANKLDDVPESQRTPEEFIRRFSAICAMERAGGTALLRAQYSDCVAAVAVYRELLKFEEEGKACGALPTSEQKRACGSRIFTALSSRAKTSYETSTRVNRILRARHIGGKCFQALGTDQANLSVLKNLRQAARAVAAAYLANNAAAARTYGRQADRAIATLMKDSSSKTHTSACPH